jgi:hypothetical protein
MRLLLISDTVLDTRSGYVIAGQTTQMHCVTSSIGVCKKHATSEKQSNTEITGITRTRKHSTAANDKLG